MPPPPSDPTRGTLVWPILGAIGLAVLVAFVVVEIYAFRTPTSEVETATTGTAPGLATTAPIVTTPVVPSTGRGTLPTTAPSSTTTTAAGGRPAVAPMGCEAVTPPAATGAKSYPAVDPVNVRVSPRSCGAVLGRPGAGTSFVARCVAIGDTIAAGGGGPNSDPFPNDYWIYTTFNGQSGWVSDATISTKSDRENRALIPSCF